MRNKLWLPLLSLAVCSVGGGDKMLSYLRVFRWLRKGANATPPTWNLKRATRALFSNNRPTEHWQKCIISEIASCTASNKFKCNQSAISLLILGLWLTKSCNPGSSPCITQLNRYHPAENSCTRGLKTRLRCSQQRDANALSSFQDRAHA